MSDWNKIKLNVENFSTEIEKEVFLNWNGLKTEMNISAIYEKYRHLFTKPLILEVKEKREHAKGEEERKLRYLQQFFVSGYLEMVVKELSDKAETMESKEKIKVDSEEIPFRLSAVKMTNEPDRTKRKKLFQARNNVIDKKNKPCLKREDAETPRHFSRIGIQELYGII